MLEHSVFVKLDNFNGIEPFYDSVTVLSCLKRMCVMFLFCAPVISPPLSRGLGRKCPQSGRWMPEDRGSSTMSRPTTVTMLNE